jgi:opacity protein-like surface antigen
MRTYLCGALVFLLLAVPATAQVNSSNDGFSLGLYVQGAGLDPEDDLNDNGGGAALELAYGFGDAFGLFLGFGVAAMEPDADKQGASYALSELDLGGRWTFRGSDARWRPYAEAALTTLLATFEDVRFGDLPRTDVEVRGPAFSAGGGIEYFFRPSWAAGLGLRWSAGCFDEVEIGNVTVELDPEDEFAFQTTRIQLGVRYRFGVD